MKIGIDAHGVGGTSLGCGNESHFGNLIKRLIRLDSANEYHIFTPHPEYFTNVVGTLPHVRYVSLQPSSQWVQRPYSLPRYSNREKLDLLHVPFIKPPFVKAKCIVTVHDICFESHPEHFRKIEVLRMRALVRPSCRSAQAIFTVSEFARQQIHDLYRVPLERIVVTPNAADHMLQCDSRTSASPALKIPEPYILYAGLLQPRKNLVRLVKAFEQLLQQAPVPHHLVLCGKAGWGNEELNETIRNSRWKDRLHLTGYVPDEQFPSLIARASLFAFPSLFEGFGIPPLEAQRCRVPVVVSNSSCFPEIYGDSVQYCEPLSVPSITHALKRVLLDDRWRETLIDRGVHNGQRYIWQQTAASVLAHYESVHRFGLPRPDKKALPNRPEALTCA